jgi:hypothetical protein
MNSLDSLLESLERVDIYRTSKEGIDADTESQVKYICAKYAELAAEEKAALKTKLGPTKAAWVILYFASRMAQSAIQLRKPEAIDQGILAFDLSNISERDWRDAIEPAARLAYAAKECDIDIVARVKALIVDISPRILSMFEEPKHPRVTRDAAGTLIFR